AQAETCPASRSAAAGRGRRSCFRWLSSRCTSRGACVLDRSCQPKVRLVQVLNARQFVRGQWRDITGARELRELLAPVDVRQRSGDDRIRQDPLQSDLTERGARARLNKELQLFDLLQSVNQPGPRPM